ncbi:MAG: hypothetical protein FIB05_02620 [Betaproteobacteria bacterium]|nr:hypothetical protein [Betaproteobacteria bacterium]
MKRLAALLSLAVLSLAAWAADPPGRVARLSLVEGEAAVYVDPDVGWEGARINATLTGENSVWTEPGARAEILFGATALRLGETTQLDILRLDNESFQAHVTRGALTLRLREVGKNESYFVSTPEGRFQFRGNGRYRLESDPARGESVLTVFAGTARLEMQGGYVNVDTGRAVRVSGGAQPRFAFEAVYSTSLDEWAYARDQRWDQRESLRYVPRQMTGWEDLDDYGTWRNDAEYGAVWYPTHVDAGWAPYRYGRWTWVRPWGWTWVDDAPWGYAPFHYGRWVYVGNRWGWYPGRYSGRPVWAPALVGWIGGSGWNLSFSTGVGGALGWYPLSPYDAFQPWYVAAPTYVTYVNRIVLPPHHRREHQHDRDRRHDHREYGATVVPRDQFGTRRPVQSVLSAVAPETIARQPVVAGAAVLPPRPATRPPDKPFQVKPTAPAASGAPVAPGAAPTSTARPAPTVKPSFPAEPVGRQPAPAPAQPALPVTRQPQAAPATQPQALPRAPAPSERPVAAPSARPAPSAPAERPSQPVTRPTPAPAERAAPPATRPTPAPVERAPQPASRPTPAPAERPAQPASRPTPAPAERAPQPAAKPAPAPERASPAPSPPPPADKPSGDKPGRGND